MTGCVTSSRPRAGQKGRNVQRGRRSRGHVIDENVCADVSTLPGPCSPEKMTTFLLVEKRLDAKWSGFRMPYEYQMARPFEYWTNGSHLVFLFIGLLFEWLF